MQGEAAKESHFELFLARHTSPWEPVSTVPNPHVKRPFRIIDLMALVAATAVAFAIFRYSPPSNIALNTVGTAWEQWLFYWMHRVTPFPALWSLTVVAITFRDQNARLLSRAGCAGVAACQAATGAITIAATIFGLLYTAHVLEDHRFVPKVFSHSTQVHPAPPFGQLTLEEIGGAAVLGVWSALAASRRWRTDSNWIDRLGRILGVIWLVLFAIYVFGYAG